MVDTINPATAVRQYSLIERIKVFWDSQEHLNVPRKVSKLLARVRKGVHLEMFAKQHVATLVREINARLK